ncbi:MAG: hypothetical protein L3J26_00145 [Candidatus Polarisedimenticolaceae bacterium]|nr:hypothetical protein [Candidatus Polarisedimenticolaceae bacterium]
MEPSLISKKVMPFLLSFIALIAATAIVDALLHLSGLTWIGRWLGIPGVLLILLSFLYSMRKRKKISFGKPKTLLKLHEVLTWTGALMVLVHAGIHVYNILPWLALVAMMVNIISGMTGQYLLDRSRRYVAEKKASYAERGLTAEAAEKELFWDSVTYDLMKRWRAVHFPITLVFSVLAITHIFTILLYWQWK